MVVPEITGEVFEHYIDWRADHPSDDLMTQLLNAEFVDETGTTRTLTREEVLMIVNLIAGAGNETTTRLIGFTGKVLADHPDQRREIAEDRTLVPQAIEELLRFEAPSPVQGALRHRRTSSTTATRCPEGSAMLLLVASANRDRTSSPTPTASTSTARSRTTSRSATASTSASAPHSLGSRAASRSTRCSSGSPSGRSTGSTRSRPAPPPCAAGSPCPSPPEDRLEPLVAVRPLGERGAGEHLEAMWRRPRTRAAPSGRRPG